MPFISPYTSHKKIPATLLNALRHHYSLVLILLLSISRKFVYFTTPISKYLNTSPQSSLTKSLLLESNLYNFLSSYNLIFLLSLTTVFIILPYHTYYIPQNIYIFYHLHTSQEISNTHTKSPSYGRHKLLKLKSFSQKAPRSHIKTLLMEGTNPSYIRPFSQKAQVLHTKALLMEGNTIHNFKTTKRALSKGKLI